MVTEVDGNVDEESSRADIRPPSKRRCLEFPTARSNVTKAKELTVGWIVTANLPFTAPSNPYLRRMLDLHDASLAKEVPWSRQAVRDTMRKLFEVKKGVVRASWRRPSQESASALTCGRLQIGTLSSASTPTISMPPFKSSRDFLPCAVCGSSFQGKPSNDHIRRLRRVRDTRSYRRGCL
jgi:hypothetical protein